MPKMTRKPRGSSPVKNKKYDSDQESDDETKTVTETEQTETETEETQNETNDDEEIIPKSSTSKTKAKKQENVQIAMFKVSIEDFDPERIVLQDPEKKSFETVDKEKSEQQGKEVKTTINFTTIQFMYNYPVRPKYTPDSKKKGTYPAGRGKLIVSMPPAICENGLFFMGNKVSAYFLMKCAQITPEGLDEDEKEKRIQRNEELMEMAIDKFDRVTEVVGKQLVEFHKAGKITISKLLNTTKSKKEGKDVFKDDPESAIEEFVKFQKNRDGTINRDLPRAIKLKMSKMSRSAEGLDATNINEINGSEIKTRDWNMFERKTIYCENDIHFHQLFCTAQNIYIQTYARSMLILDVLDKSSSTTQQDRFAEWSKYDSGFGDSLHRKLELMRQEAKTKERQKEEMTSSIKDDDTKFDGVVNTGGSKGGDDDDKQINMNDISEEKMKMMMKMMQEKGFE